MKNGYGIFSEKVTQNSGEVIHSGEIKVESPSTGDLITVPFILEYKIIDNND